MRLEADTSKKRGAAAIANQSDDVEDDDFDDVFADL